MTEEPNKFGAAFKEMQSRIERNDSAEFAGALLIVPPEGEPIAVLMSDPKKDVEAFWAMVNGKVAVATAELQLKKQGGYSGFGPARR